MSIHRIPLTSSVLFAIMFILCGCSTEPKPEAQTPEINPDGSGVTKSASAGEMTVEQVQKIVQLHNRGVGHLENHEWADAEAALSELQALLPENVDAANNLAVSRTLSLIDRSSPYSQSKDPKAYATAVQKANDAIKLLDALAKTDEQKAVAALIAGKQAAYEDSSANPGISVALEHLRRAITLSGDRPQMWYALALAMEGHRDYSDSPELIKALQKTSELAPENLAVIGKLMEKQALGLNSKNAETKQLGATISNTLDKVATLLLPLNSAIKQQRRVDLVETIRKALGGPGKDNPALLLGPAMMTKNLMLPELATQIDQRRIDLNLLEYLIVDLPGRLALKEDVRAAIFPPAEPTVLKEFTPGSGLPEITGVTQVQLQDMNLDGADDLILVQDGRIRIYSRGLDVSAPWTLLMESPQEAGTFSSFLLADIDRDFDRALSDIKNPMKLRDRDGDQKIVKDGSGKNRWFDTDLDIVAWGDAGVVMMKNESSEAGDRSLTVLPQAATVAGVNDADAADLESDGDLDLIFATSAGMTLWKNIDGKTFEPITDGVTLPSYPIVAVSIGDWNRDMAMDVIGVSADGKAGWLQNLLHSRFRWLDGLPCPAGAEDVLIEDFNSDSRWDLLIAGSSGTSLIAPKNNELLTDSTAESLATVSGVSLHRADLDNDGRSDLVSAGPAGLTLLRGTSDGKAEDLTKLLPTGTKAIRVASSDMDDDGDLDLILVSDDGKLQQLTNNGGNENEWVEVVVRAVGDDPQFPSNRVNMHARGSVIELRAGTAYQAHVITTPKLHLGLGKAKEIDTIRVILTDGVPQNITNTSLLRARLGILSPQILNGSCPYIYTWNGERFEFFSDCLWAAPIGLVQATGDMAPTREWEYLMIPGEQLKPRDGRYVLQLTEELWEAAYFDEVKLMAVDHPAEISIFTNEKVGSPEMAAHRIHTVQNARLPVSAVDGTGRDLLPGLKSLDQDYVQPFKGRILQGLTDEWIMEFDLGSLAASDGSRPKNIRLVMIGWVFPTNTSINQAIVQNPELDPPAPPSLEVVDSNGEWKTVRPFIGFPSGKTKAMVVDLTDAFLTTDYRLRIRSSMELYWDQVFFTVDEEDAETQSQDCSLAAADLHYRGFSRRTYADNALFREGHAPEGYDYDSVTTVPRWNEMLGRFTRYGEVLPLLGHQDDQMVVMGPGDELTVEFVVPEKEIPAGWKRDFVLYNVGWDKDADLSTVYGQSSEPYPFKAMTRYPLAPDESQPSSPEYLRYLEEYQTREYQRFEFRDLIRDGL